MSVLFAVADEDMSGALSDAHERAVDAALAYLEREACFTRRGRDGVERLAGEGFVAASYRHRMSRAGDPQLHTHVVVANMTRAEGRYTSLDAHAIYEHKSAAGALYRAVLRAEVSDRLPWVSWRAVSRGLFEIEGFPENVLRHFSQRRVEIEERALELAGVAADGLSRERMQGIALATRKAKRYGVDGGSWRDQARARAAEHGFGDRELGRLQTRSVTGLGEADASRLTARLSGRNGLTATHNTFARRHALAEIAGFFEQGATVAQLEQTTSRYLTDPTVRTLHAGPKSEPRYTTEGLLAGEREIVQGAERRAGDRLEALPAHLVDRVLAGYQPALNDDQAAVLHAIVSGGRGVDAVTALAGTGKTTMIGAVAACYAQAGWRVLGTAPTGRAARELRDTAGIPASTMHALLARLGQDGGFTARTVVMLDEAGMAPTRQTAELFAYAERAGAKLIAVGDPGQLRSVQAGGWLGAIARRQPTPMLREVMRQRDPK
ncbi:MAG: MobF family relaxase, partial [Solirubrobacteraceae bacterium]